MHVYFSHLSLCSPKHPNWQWLLWYPPVEQAAVTHKDDEDEGEDDPNDILVLWSSNLKSQISTATDKTISQRYQAGTDDISPRNVARPLPILLLHVSSLSCWKLTTYCLQKVQTEDESLVVVQVDCEVCPQYYCTIAPKVRTCLTASLPCKVASRVTARKTPTALSGDRAQWDSTPTDVHLTSPFDQQCFETSRFGGPGVIDWQTDRQTVRPTHRQTDRRTGPEPHVYARTRLDSTECHAMKGAAPCTDALNTVAVAVAVAQVCRPKTRPGRENRRES